MGQDYSKDLRERVAAFVDAGHSRQAAARHFSVSPSFAIKLLQLRDRTGSLEPRPQGRPKGHGKLAPHEAFLIGIVKDKPDITMPELADRLLAERGVLADPAVLSRLLCRRGFTYKKIADGLGMRTQGRA